MSVRILFAKGEDSKPEREVVLNKDVITIGREESNVLQLDGSLVSKKHARIEGHDQSYVIIDLRSTNSTFLNKERLVPDKPYALHLGDRLRVGEFQLQIAGFDREAARKDVVEEKPPLPEAGVNIEAQLARVVQEYAGPGYLEKRTHLKHALAELIGRLESSDVQALAESLRRAEAEVQRLSAENKRLQESVEEAQRNAQALPAQPEPMPVYQPQPISSESVSAQGLTRTMRIFLNALTRLVRGRASFRNEFLGATMISDGELSPLLSGSTEAGMKYLLEGTASEDELAAHNAALQRALDEVVFHVVGLLDGYRTSVDDGVRRLLQKADPEVFKVQLAELKFKIGPIEIPYRFVPLLVDMKAMRLSQRAHKELSQEDRGVLEKRYFRPAFIRGYDRCISSLRGSLGAERDQKKE